MVNKDKLNFLKTDFITLLKQLKGDEKPKWGVMSAQQMIEHMGGSFLNAAGIIKIAQATPNEQLPAFKSFMMSDKEFRPKTKNPTLSENGYPLQFSDIPTAIAKLEKAIVRFENHFAADPNKTELNAIFGELNFEEAVQLLYKHSRHHLRQFALIE